MRGPVVWGARKAEESLAGQILIVDDDARLCRVLARILERAGYAIRTAHDGARALAEVRSERPDLVLLDLLLPGKSGSDVLDELGRMPGAPPIITMSGVCGRPKNSRVFLAKPFKGAELLEEVERAIGPATTTTVAGPPAKPLAELLAAAFEDEATGRLRIRAAGRESLLFLDAGRVVGVRSAHAGGAPADKAVALFALDGADARFLAGKCEPDEDERLYDLEPEELILRGSRHVPLARVKERLAAHADCVVEVDSAQLELSTMSGSLLQLFARLKPGVRVRDVADADLPQLYGAWVVRRVVLAGMSGGAGDVQRREQELARLADKKEQDDLFAALGLNPAASAGEIEEAARRLEEEYAETRFVEQPRRLRELAERLRGRVETARAVLTDDLRRQAYLRALEQRARSLEADDAPLTQMACDQADRHRAQRLVDARSYQKALPLLERLVANTPGDVELACWFGWTLFAVDPGEKVGTQRAIEVLKKLMKSEPELAAAPYYLGRILKGVGQVETARKLFRRALARDPDHRDAARELRVLSNRAGAK